MSDPTFTITHLLTAFRRALQAMAPIADEVGVTWRDDEAYDQWEALEGNLFDVLVVSAIAGDPDITPDGRVLGRYGSWARPRGFTPHSWIEVGVPEREGRFAFRRFGSENDFGVMEVVPIDDSGRWTDDIETIAWTPERTFSVRLRATGAPDRRVDQVTPTEPGWPIVRRE